MRGLLVVSAVGMLAALVWLLLWDDAGEPLDEGALSEEAAVDDADDLLGNAPPSSDEGARLEGRPNAHPKRLDAPAGGPWTLQVPPTKAKLTKLHGYVVGAGKAIEGAAVYAFGKREGFRGFSGAKTSTDADGKWRLSVANPKVFWIGAKAQGYVNTFVDGATTAAGRAVRIDMAYVESLRVLLLDANDEPVEGEGIHLKPIPMGGWQVDYPGPADRGPELYEATDEDGFATFELTTSGPVVVLPRMDDATAEPAEQWLPRASGTVTFRVRPGALLKLKVQDAGTGAAIEDSAWIEVRDVGTGRSLDQARYLLYEGRIEETLSFAPGWYDIVVYAKDREPVVLPNVRLGTKDDTPEHTASMKLLPKIGSVEIKLTTPGHSLRQQPRLFIRREEAGWDRRWEPLVVGKWQRAEQVFEAQLRPGPYEIAASDVIHGVAGRRRVTVRPGQATKVGVHLGAGLRFKLYDVIPRDLEIRHIRVEVGGLGPFAAVGNAGGIVISSDEGLAQFIATWRHRDPMLGPYPGDSATVHVTEWDGVTRAYPVR